MPKLFNNVDTFVPDKLIAGSDIPLLVKAVKLKAGQGVVKRGTVLGNIGLALGAVTKTLTNTGDATIATAATALAKGVQVGTYALQCITGPTKPLEVGDIVAGANAGDAEIVDADLGDNVQVGTYTIKCVTAPSGASANDAVFAVFAPDGSRLADATQGVAYAGGHLVFTIGVATAADAEVGDVYTIAVVSGAGVNNAVFSVHAPDGSRLADATQGIAYAAGHLVFTVSNAIAVDSIIGDSFTIAVAAGSGLAVKVDIAKFDGSGVADGILAVDTDTGGADAVTDVYAEAYRTGHFNRKALIVAAGDNITSHEARLRELGILLSDNIPY